MPLSAIAQPEAGTLRLLVAGPAGGPADVSARLIEPHLTRGLGRSVVVENLPPTPKLVAQTIMRAPADGSTLLVANTAILATYPAVTANPGYDAARDIVPVAGLTKTHQVLVVPASLAVQSVRELVDYARANPGKLNLAAAGGAGVIPHLAGALFMAQTGAQLVPVFYRGAADAVTALLGNHVDAAFENVTILLSHIRAGKLRALAVTGEKRSPQLPDVPTMAEAGVPNCEVVSFFGLVAPAGTSADVVTRVNAAVNKGLATTETAARLAQLGAEPILGTPQEFSAFAASERERWVQVAAAAGIRTE
jgi:tripartite-type tricarboxylate transporter receptor subunit TctC